MERGYRLVVAGANAGRRPPSGPLGGTAALVLAALVAAAGAALSSEGGKETEAAATPDADKLPVIVHLLASGETGSDNSIAAVTSRVMERLEAEMSEEDLAAVRTFAFFPAIALSADRDLLFLLLSMPEVMSIERDHEIQALSDSALGLEFPPVLMPAPLESEPTLDSQEQNLDLQPE